MNQSVQWKCHKGFEKCSSMQYAYIWMVRCSSWRANEPLKDGRHVFKAQMHLWAIALEGRALASYTVGRNFWRETPRKVIKVFGQTRKTNRGCVFIQNLSIAVFRVKKNIPRWWFQWLLSCCCHFYFYYLGNWFPFIHECFKNQLHPDVRNRCKRLQHQPEDDELWRNPLI